MPDADIIAIYIDHGLRPKSSIAADIAAVRAQARHARATVLVRRIKFPRLGVSLEAAARHARYAELARVATRAGAALVVTGHHRDDVSETALLALMRGSGSDGVAAIRRARTLAPGITLLRPLLAYSKAELREFVRSTGVPFAIDETNEDPRLRRTAARTLLRELERAVPGAGKAIARSAALLAADRALLASLARSAHRRALIGGSETDLSARALRALHPALLRRVIRHAVRTATGSLRDFHFSHCEAIARALLAGRGGSFHAGPATIELSAGRLMVRPRTQRTATRAVDRAIVVPRRGAIARNREAALALRHTTRGAARKNAILLDPEKLPPGTRLSIRMPRQGDSCVPSGRHRATSLARFFAKAGIPKHRRALIPLLCRNGTIVAALGVRVMEPFSARGHRVLECMWDGSQVAGADGTRVG